jgi:hypothetical protein
MKLERGVKAYWLFLLSQQTMRDLTANLRRDNKAAHNYRHVYRTAGRYHDSF